MDQDLAIAYVLPGDTWHELQNDLQIGTTSAGLGGAQVKPSCETTAGCH